MAKTRNILARQDIMDMAIYHDVRTEKRREISLLKRNRRVAVGPFATFHFECYQTMWMQVHEMLFIEQGGEEQIAGEIEAYNPLIPRGDELIATLMLEIDHPIRRERELYQLAGIENTIRLLVNGTAIAGQSIEDDIARTTEDGKTSSIHFIRFPFSSSEITDFRAPDARVALGFEHVAYGHEAIVTEVVRKALASDFCL